MRLNVILTFLILMVSIESIAKLTRKQRRRLEKAQKKMDRNYNPSSWNVMSPINSCPEFKMRWTFYEGLYWISYKKENGQYLKNPISLQSINNLSVVTDQVADEVERLCPGPHQSEGTGQSCNPLDALSSEYIKLAEQSAKVVDQIGDDCANVTKWIELQDRITNLTDEQLVTVREKGHFFKMFVDEEADRMIDMFTVCGGKKFSDKFVYNLIVLEAKNACLMPKPPGSLTWDQVRSVASRISKDYERQGIMSINKKKDEITKRAYSSFVLEVTADGAKSILPEGLDPHEFVKGTEAYKKMMQVPPEQLSEYITLVYQPDISIELGEKAFPLLLESNMKDKLPPGWNDAQKEKFIAQNVLPNSQEAMQECLRPVKEKINYNHNASSQVNIDFRQWLKDDYCEKNSDECKVVPASDENSCSAAPNINLMSGNPDETDLDVVASCVYEGVLLSVEPLLGGIIAAQKDVFADSMDLTDEMVDSFTDKTMDELMRCVNTDEHTREVYRQQGGYNPVFLSKTEINASTLRKFTPDQFTDLLVHCSGQAERVVSADFVQQLVLNNPTISSTFTQGQVVELNGQEFRQGSIQIAQTIVSESFNPCMDLQEDLKANPTSTHELSNIEATLCTPLVEMHAAQAVIDRTLARTYADEELDNDEVRASLKEFNECSEKARKTLLSDIGSTKSSTPLTNAREAAGYIENNPAFYSCITEAISDSAHIIGGEKYEAMVDKMIRQGKLINKNDIRALKSDVQVLLKDCFKDKMQELENFRAFSDYNEGGGLDRLQTQCQEQVTELVFPQILVKEAASQLRSLERQGLIEERDISLVLSQTAASLRAIDDVSIPSDLDYKSGYRPLESYEVYLQANPDGNVQDYYKKYGKLTHYSYLESYKKWQAENPNDDMDDYVEHYQRAIMPHAVRQVHEEFFKRLDKFTLSAPAPRRKFPELKEKINASCMQDLFESMKDSMAKDKSSKPFVLDDLLESISNGLKYSAQLGETRHQTNMRKFSKLCENPKRIKSMDDLLGSGALDFIAKQQIYDAVKTKFEAMPGEDFAKEQAAFGGDMRKMSFARKKKNDMGTLVRQFMGDPLKFEKFLFDGKNQDLIDFALKNKDELEDPDGPKMKQLTTKVVSKMFSDKSKGSFADKFAEIQLVNSLGIAGYESARDAVDAAADREGGDMANDTIRQVGRRALNNEWTTTNIHDMIGWSNLRDSTRKDLINSMYNNAVLPSVDGSSEYTQKQKREKLKQKLVTHTQTYQYSVNYRTTKNGFLSQTVTNKAENVTFEERLTRRITRFVEENVSYGDIAGEIWNEL